MSRAGPTSMGRQRLPISTNLESTKRGSTMRACIVSDHEPTSTRVRQLLLEKGLDRPAPQVLALAQAAQQLGAAQPELLVVTLAPDADRALAVLGNLRLGTPARILAVGPTADSRLILRALRAGAADYLDEADLEAGLVDALARLRAEMPAQAEPGRLIALLAPSGGSGSSTLAVNVATVLAGEHKSSALFDLKLEAGDLAALLDLRPTHTLADLCQNAANMDRVMFERSLSRHA